MAEPLQDTADSLGTGAMAAPAAEGTASDAGAERRQECISVVARVRPSDNPAGNLALRQNCIEVAVPRAAGEAMRMDEYRFQFANVYGPDSTQADVFNGSARDMVLGALDGINCTIFAYGQTGSGKTHTICGGKGSYNDRGIIPRAMGCLFDAIGSRQDGTNYNVKVSFIEVYKEVGYNLLAKEFGKGGHWPVVSVSIIDDQPILNNANPISIASEDEGLHHYFIGDTHRTVAETPHNLNSSRSHCLFTIFVEAVDPVAQTVRTSKIQIVDLAGSERLKPYEIGSQSDSKLMGQAVSINLSLHWLEAVINALNTRNRGSIPYRNSFLTKVLKDALGGNARAVMFATINPNEATLPETLSTCRFSMRVANVQTNARVNEELDPKLLIAALKQEKEELRAALSAAEGGEPAEELSPDELRRRIRLFLEDDTGGADAFKVSCLRDAFAAFRIFRDLYWELLRTRAAAPAKAWPSDSGESPTPRTANAAKDDEKKAATNSSAALQPAKSELREVTSSSGPSSGQDKQQLEALQNELKERDGELKMLRAALAAQPSRPAARPARAAPPLRCTRLAVGTQTEAVKTPRRAKPKRPSSADARPYRPAASFSMDDVVERSFNRDGSSSLLPRISDPRVADFRTLRQRQQDGADNARMFTHAESPRPQSGIDLLRSGQSSSQAPQSKNVWAAPCNTSGLVNSATSLRIPETSEVAMSAAVPTPPPKPVLTAGSSSAWLSATTALTQAEVALVNKPDKAKEVFLQHDPRAGDIWPNDMKKLRSERLERMEEARKLGEDIERIKEAKVKVQSALEALKVKLREAESQAAVDPGGAAENTVTTLRSLLAVEEPKLVQLLNEKQQRYELDYSRLSELKRELAHLKHGEDKLSTAIQAEFTHWCQAVEARYPGSTQGNAQVDSSSSSAAAYPTPSSARPPLPTSSPAQTPTSAMSPAPSCHTVASASGPSARPPEAPPSTAVPAPEASSALAKAEAALRSLRTRLEEARESGDTHRVQMLEQLLASEEPRLARLRTEGSV